MDSIDIHCTLFVRCYGVLTSLSMHAPGSPPLLFPQLPYLNSVPFTLLSSIMQSHTRQVARHQVVHAWVYQPLVQLVLGPQEELEQAWKPGLLLLQISTKSR